MTGDIVNLNKVRKAKGRAGKARDSEENRSKFGRTKSERRYDDDENARRAAALDGAKIASEPAPAIPPNHPPKPRSTT